MMGLSHELRRLRAEHSEIRTCATQLNLRLTLVSDENIKELLPILQQFHALLARHLKCEDWILFPRIRAGLNDHLIQVTEHLCDEYGDLADQLENYVQHWDEANKRKNWPEFCAQTKALIKLADRRAHAEEKLLFPNLESDYTVHRYVV